jgi:tRNA (guanine37-N1)-methyltransferase
MKVDILTLFPEMFTPVTESSILGKAGEKGILHITLTDIRNYTVDKHNKVDEAPFGGGSGMVLTADPVFRALEETGVKGKRILYPSPRGSILTEHKIRELAEEKELVLLCGHYEGIDQRVLDHFEIEEISIGDYILTGGELPAMVIIDAVARMLPGVLSNSCSAFDESIYSGLLEHPQYTRPREYRGLEVPEVLVSGNHKQIALWKLEKSLELTKERRPDLLKAFFGREHQLTKEEKKILGKMKEIKR